MYYILGRTCNLLHTILQRNKYVKNLPTITISFNQNPDMLKQNIRTYWRESKIIMPRITKKYECKCISGNCGKPPLTRIEPYKEQFSKCLEDYNKPVTKRRRRLFKFYKSSPVIKEKPTNCNKIEPKQIESSLWKRIFGIDSKKSCSLSCICPMTYQKQMILRRQDPRLSNPCYQSTPGDVLIYTQIINSKKVVSDEPQPRSTPPYKVPRAALCKMIIADIEKVTTTLDQCVAMWSQHHDNCADSKFKIHSLPFHEMRPSSEQKRAFTCRDGISAENVMYPSNRAKNPSKVSFPTVIENSTNLLSKKLLTNSMRDPRT